jgi:glycerol-3-phosphate acyltransferase PlsY
MIFLLIVVLAYLLGSIPFGLLVARSRGIDIRKHGSGNIGATNVSRTLGKKWGILVFALDFLKGAFAVWIGRWLMQLQIQHELAGGYFTVAESRFTFAGIIAALAVILGHNFPVWLKFKGGKGIATSGGVLLALMPLASVICIALWCVLFLATKYVSLASVIAAAVLPLVVWLLLDFAHIGDWPLFWFSLAIAALAISRHKPNIQRLLAGTELRFGKQKS